MSRKIDNVRQLYLEGIRDGHPRQAVEKYTGARYTQHSTGVRDGVDGFVEFFEDFLARNPIRDIQLVRTIEDGANVFVHAFQSLNNGAARWVTMDFFDTDADGRVVEHWDVIAPYTEPTLSGHTSVDGPTSVVDLDRTDQNKAVVRGLITDVLAPGGGSDTIDLYVSGESYVQHTSDVPDGLDAFRTLLTPAERRPVYDEIVLMVGQGNFVATLCRARRDGAPYAQADLFRLDGGLIVEHWDAAEPVPPEQESVNSGKF